MTGLQPARRGEGEVAVLRIKSYRTKILGPRESLVDVFARSPCRETDPAVSRNRQTGREVDCERLF